MSALSEFNSDIEYHPGCQNTAAGVRSKYHYEKNDNDIKIENETVKAICGIICCNSSFVYILPCSSNNIADIFS